MSTTKKGTKRLELVEDKHAIISDYVNESS